MNNFHAVILALVCAGMVGCAAPLTNKIEVTPQLIDALAKDTASFCYINLGDVNSLMYGTLKAGSTFCRTNAATGTLSVSREGVITITHGAVQPVPAMLNVPVTVTPAGPPK